MASYRKFCLDHRTEDAHECPRKGEWARKRRERNARALGTTAASSRPNAISGDYAQCSSPTCKTFLKTATDPGVRCPTCRRDYCLKHKLEWDHDCKNVTPLGVGQGVKPDRGLGEALGRLKAWGAAKKAAAGASKAKSATDSTAAGASPKQSSIRQFTSSLGKSKAQKSQAARLLEVKELKTTAKGPSSVPEGDRIYVYAEAEAFHTDEQDRPGVDAKIPHLSIYLNRNWVVGRALDEAAKLLQVRNANNQTEDEKDRLRVFHINSGRLLEFGEKLDKAVKNGDTLVLLRGIGPAASD